MSWPSSLQSRRGRLRSTQSTLRFKERRDNLSQRMEENTDPGRKISAHSTSTISPPFSSIGTLQLIKFVGYKTATFLPRLQFWRPQNCKDCDTGLYHIRKHGASVYNIQHACLLVKSHTEKLNRNFPVHREKHWVDNRQLRQKVQTILLRNLAFWKQGLDRNILSNHNPTDSGSPSDSLTALFKIGKCSPSNFVLLCKNCFGYSGSFTFPYKSSDQFVNFCKIPASILTGIVLNP